MREIKFRAYDEEANVMVYSDEHNLIDYSYEYFFEVLKDKVICVFLVDYDDSFGAPSTDRYELEKVMQYTGLHDKNGVEIYEGDVIKGKEWECGKSHRHIGVVEYIGSSFKSVGIGKYLGINGSVDGSYEVIGNIHEVKQNEI